MTPAELAVERDRLLEGGRTPEDYLRRAAAYCRALAVPLARVTVADEK